MNLLQIEKKEQALKDLLSKLDGLMVAYSGGVDSSLLAFYADQALRKKAIIVIAISPSLAQDELAFARDQAEQFNWNLLEINTDEVEKPEYLRNDSMRCYFCKETLFDFMQKLACQKSIKNLAYGATIDDLSDFRPGHQAAVEYNILSPLTEVGLSKEEIRYLAKNAGLPSWDKPQSACLSSRLPTSSPITVEKLTQVDRAEAVLRSLGLGQVRVRHHGEIARIEVEPEQMGLFISEDISLPEVVERLKELGFTYITLDLEGYRSGSLNPAINQAYRSTKLPRKTH